jgi:nitrate/nitrite-specific signal transduction histidine kinase
MRLTIQQRALLILVNLVAVMLIVSLFLFRAMQAAEENMRNAQQAAYLANQITELHLDALSVISILDTFSLTRPETEAQDEMDRRLNLLNGRISNLQAIPFGLSLEMRTANGQILADLNQVGFELSDLSKRLYLLASQNRWGSALRLRQTQMADLQERLSRDLNQLQDNLDRDLLTSTAQAERIQNITRISIFISIGGALTVGAAMMWFARRTIIRPIQQLTGTVQRITGGDLAPFTPFSRGDEIGDLSRAMSQMTDWLRDLYETLAERVAERTRQLEERTHQIQMASQTGRDIAAVHQLEDLLYQAAALINERFAFAQTEIYLNDAQGEYTILRASSTSAATSSQGGQGSPAGEEHQEQSRLKMSDMSLVAQAARRGERRFALSQSAEVGPVGATDRASAVRPNAPSEVAVPLKSGGRVLGVLHVHSQGGAAFDEVHLAVLQVLADQLATAVQNARLLAEMQANLVELQAAYGQSSQQAWKRFLHGRTRLGYEFASERLAPIEAAPGVEASAGAESRLQPVSSPVEASGSHTSEAKVIPLKVRGAQIGVLEIWPGEEEFSESQSYLVEAISDRLGQVLESARLYEQAQARAAGEETLNRLAATVARAVDSEGVLQAAAQALGRLPGVDQARVFIGGDDEPGA